MSSERSDSVAAKVEIISRKKVKPSTPTPSHLKIYKLSLMDQFYDHIYLSFIHFYPNNDQGNSTTERRIQVLKKSLSRTLSHLYPLAGELSKDGLHIECNDNGAYYVEARVRDRLSDFLIRPKHNEIIRLLPFHPKSEELAAQTCMLLIQVSIFDCGGIAIGLFGSHKLLDGQTHITFFSAWAAQARGSGSGSGSATPQILPDLYTAPNIFVQNPTWRKHQVKSSTRPESEIKLMKRFVFNASDLAALKAKTGARSRVLAVTGLIWKCGMSASQKRILGKQQPSCLIFPINLRPKIASRRPISPYSIGNLFWPAQAYADLTPNGTARGLRLETVMGSLRDGVARIEDEHFVELITEENGSENIIRIREELSRDVASCAYNGGDVFVIASFCNGGFYEADFGWGKPIWSTFGGGNGDLPNYIVLMDTRSGGGIEALVTLDEATMNIFQSDPEILAFATLNPSPLQIHNPLPRSYL